MCYCASSLFTFPQVWSEVLVVSWFIQPLFPRLRCQVSHAMLAERRKKATAHLAKGEPATKTSPPTSLWRWPLRRRQWRSGFCPGSVFPALTCYSASSPQLPICLALQKGKELAWFCCQGRFCSPPEEWLRIQKHLHALWGRVCNQYAAAAHVRSTPSLEQRRWPSSMHLLGQELPLLQPAPLIFCCASFGA